MLGRLEPSENLRALGRQALGGEEFVRLGDGVGLQLVEPALELRETGAEENTLILFLADNGGCAEEFSAAGVKNNPSIPERTRDGRPVRNGNNPLVAPGPEDTYQSYGMPWATPLRIRDL